MKRSNSIVFSDEIATRHQEPIWRMGQPSGANKVNNAEGYWENQCWRRASGAGDPQENPQMTSRPG